LSNSSIELSGVGILAKKKSKDKKSKIHNLEITGSLPTSRKVVITGGKK
jgi:hypothetical protein